jgi:hypothetical protein
MNILTSSLLISAVALSGTAAASTKNVPGDFATVQQALDAAVTGDVIQIAPGRYVENLVIATPGITLEGLKIDGFKVVIDGSYTGPCLLVQADSVTLMSLTLDNGGPTTGDGTQTPVGLLVTGSDEHILRCLARSSAGAGIKLVGNGEIVDSTAIACQGAGLVVESGNAAGPTTRLSHNDAFHCGEGLVLTGGPFQSDHNRAIGNASNGLRVELSGDGATGTLQPGSSTFSHDSATGNHGRGLLVVDDFGGLGLVEHSSLGLNDVGLDVTATVAGLQLDDIDINENTVGGAWLRTVAPRSATAT